MIDDDPHLPTEAVSSILSINLLKLLLPTILNTTETSTKPHRHTTKTSIVLLQDSPTRVPAEAKVAMKIVETPLARLIVEMKDIRREEETEINEVTKGVPNQNQWQALVQCHHRQLNHKRSK